MSSEVPPATPEPSREELERLPGVVLLEFGAAWCSYCRALAPQVAALLQQYPQVRHVWIEDGPGKPLGRSFRVKLWPTLIFLRNGQVVRQLVRPTPAEVQEAFVSLTAS